MHMIADLKTWLRSMPRIRNPFTAPVVHVVYRVAGLHGTYCYKCKLGSMNNRHKLLLELRGHFSEKCASGSVLSAPIIEIVEIF